MGGSDKPKPPPKLAGGKFELDKRLGAGCFGEVYRAHNTETKEAVAVKFEDFQGHAPQLEHESDILKLLSKPVMPQGIAELHHFGREGRFHCMVIELLGRSLEDRVQGCKGKLTPTSTVLIAEQVVRRIEHLHSKGIVHRDIKPENFMFGINNKIHHIYIIDFGLSKRYWDGKAHASIRTRLSLTGTARYASINAHRGVEQSRRDDMEAIGHMFLYFLRGHLPWSGLEAKTQEEKYRKIREKKEETDLNGLSAGFPDAFKDYLREARDMQFKDRPDYAKWKKRFLEAREALQAQAGSRIEDHSYQWLEGRDLGALQPVVQTECPRQPDEAVPKKGGMSFCFCGGRSAVRDE